MVTFLIFRARLCAGIAGATGALGRVVARDSFSGRARRWRSPRNGEALHALFADLALNPDHLLIGDIDLRALKTPINWARGSASRFGHRSYRGEHRRGPWGGAPVHETPVAVMGIA